MEWIVWMLMVTWISAFVITTIADIIVMGSYSLKISISNSISQFVVSKENHIDIQKGNECSGYAAAYLLRHYDIPANGTEIYQKMPYKASDGCVPPKGIKKVLESYGFHVKYCAGNLNALKAEVCKGNPVIVFIKVRRDKRWLHFVPVVGYDKDNLFLAESAAESVNCSGKTYNRTISNRDFLALWNTAMLKMPLYTHTFYVVAKK
ncbi:MAG: C39 family peptidase [Lachnospiraceae bacterium]|nr:C39 family peptidase [Lachnospiraceae bacterium]MDE7201262.1 C39 family peptidase [Lachnospiraceae bacterium]